MRRRRRLIRNLFILLLTGYAVSASVFVGYLWLQQKQSGRRRGSAPPAAEALRPDPVGMESEALRIRKALARVDRERDLTLELDTLLAAGRVSEAVKLMTTYTNPPVSRLLLEKQAELFLRQGKYDAALMRRLELLQIEAGDLEPVFKYLQHAMAARHYQAALEAGTWLMARQEANAETYEKLADAALALDRPETAVEYLTQALAVDPLNRGTRQTLSRLFLELNRPADALRILQQSLELEMHEAQTYRLLLQAMDGQAAEEETREILNQAVQRFGRATVRDWLADPALATASALFRKDEAEQAREAARDRVKIDDRREEMLDLQLDESF